MDQPAEAVALAPTPGVPRAPCQARAAAGLRIAVVTETWPPEVNGVASTIARVVEGLRDRGHALQLVRPRQRHEAPPAGDEADPFDGLADERFDEVRLPGLPIPRYPQLRMGLPATRALVTHWARRRPDVVHLVTEGPLGWSALRAARRLQLPVVSDFRTNFHAYSAHYGLGWLQRPVMAYLRHFHNATACTMVPTAALQAELAAHGLRRLQVVARGVDTRLFHPGKRSTALRLAWGAAPRDPVALYVGRLAPEKNLALVIDAFEALREREPRARLVLVGDGPLRAALQARHPGVVFAGLRRGEDLAMHYASADVFLFASLTETWGNVVPEAMASGLAVVSHDHAAAAELIRHGDSGLLARCDDRGEFVRVAASVASEGERLRALGERARAVALGHDWARIVGHVEAQYRAAMQAAAPALRQPGGAPWPHRSSA